MWCMVCKPFRTQTKNMNYTQYLYYFIHFTLNSSDYALYTLKLDITQNGKEQIAASFSSINEIF